LVEISDLDRETIPTFAIGILEKRLTRVLPERAFWNGLVRRSAVLRRLAGTDDDSAYWRDTRVKEQHP